MDVFLCSKTARVRVKSYFFHKSLFGDIKLSDLVHRNRKLSAHDCTDHIKTLFSSDNYHETRNIRVGQGGGVVVYQYTGKKFAKIPQNTQNSSKYTQN